MVGKAHIELALRIEHPKTGEEISANRRNEAAASGEKWSYWPEAWEVAELCSSAVIYEQDELDLEDEPVSSGKDRFDMADV